MIPIARPVLGREEVDAAGRAISSGWVAQGPEVAAFEKEFASTVNAEYACAVSNCTAALHLALRAVGVNKGSEVITVSHSFIATANSIRYCDATPVFVDITPHTFNMNPDLVEPMITNSTTAILCVHQMGMPCDIEPILDIAAQYGLPVIEDAACAIGSETQHNGQWQRVGRPHADIACFSFHPRKVLTTGDGGMLTTANPEFDRKFRLWRQHGMCVPDTHQQDPGTTVFEEYTELGYNYRMTDIQAAVGRVQLKRLDNIVAKRRQLAAHYHQLLSGTPEVQPPVNPPAKRSNWQSYCVRLREDIDQRTIMQYMRDNGIATKQGIMCAHREPAFAGIECRMPLIESERAQDHSIILPLYHDMTDKDQQTVTSALLDACQRTKR